MIDIVQKIEKIFKRVCVRVIRKKKKKKGSHRCKVLPMYKRVTVPSLERKTVVSCFPIPGMGWLIKRDKYFEGYTRNPNLTPKGTIFKFFA